MVFQVGANGLSDQRVSVSVGDMPSAGLGISGLNVASAANANAAVDAIDRAIASVSSERSLGVSSESLYTSESSIRDTDMAKSIMDLTRRSIMMQASQAMLSQGMNLSRSYTLGLLLR